MRPASESTSRKPVPRGAGGSGVRIHVFDTGTVRMRHSHAREPYPAVFLGVPYDPDQPVEWTVYAWAVEHEEGVIVVDTGFPLDASMPGYFPWYHPCFRQLEVEMRFEQQLHLQLLEAGIDCLRDVRKLVLTSLYPDRAGAVHDFPNSEIVVCAKEYRRSQGVLGLYRGYLPGRLPTWFAPDPVRLQPSSLGAFDHGVALTRDGTVALVPMPGRTPHGLAVRVDDGDDLALLSGETGLSGSTEGPRRTLSPDPAGPTV